MPGAFTYISSSNFNSGTSDILYSRGTVFIPKGYYGMIWCASLSHWGCHFTPWNGIPLAYFHGFAPRYSHVSTNFATIYLAVPLLEVPSSLFEYFQTSTHSNIKVFFPSSHFNMTLWRTWWTCDDKLCTFLISDFPTYSPIVFSLPQLLNPLLVVRQSFPIPKDLLKNHGERKIQDVTVEMAINGARAVKSMVTETSDLDSNTGPFGMRVEEGGPLSWTKHLVTFLFVKSNGTFKVIWRKQLRYLIENWCFFLQMRELVFDDHSLCFLFFLRNLGQCSGVWIVIRQLSWIMMYQCCTCVIA